MSRPTVFSIAPDAPFLPSLVDAVLDGRLLAGWPRNGPFWLTDITIVLPTRRAQLALANAFLARGQRLLPDIRTFGGEVADEEPFLPPYEAEPPPPAASALERRLVLARLVHAWAGTLKGSQRFASPPHAAEILSLAQSLGELIDDLHVQGVFPPVLRGVVPENLAENWQEALEFLEIALSYWPEALEQRGKADAAALRNARLQRQAEMAPLIYGDRPVIAAGTTGSIPATAALLAAIADLPRGSVVLPGLDTGLTPAEHQALLEEERTPHGHAQYGLARLLRRLGTTPGAVVELGPDRERTRTLAVRRALALADATGSWAGDLSRAPTEVLDRAFSGVSIIAARNEDQQARAIALCARDGLAIGSTVGIVTPDRNLARRIAAELARFEVFVDDAAGAPLFQSPAGRLAREALAFAANRCAPVDLIALLANRATSFARDRLETAALVQPIDLGLLRGQRPNPGFAGLRTTLAANLSGKTPPGARRLTPAEGEAIAALLDRLERAVEALTQLLGRSAITAHDLAEAVVAVCRNLSDNGTRIAPDLPGGDVLEAWAEELTQTGDAGPPFSPSGLEAVMAQLMSGFQVRNRLPRRSDIEIWGQLEARLQNPDLLIVAALNEDIWPQPAQPGPWLSRGMRIAAGLEPPERLQGLVAHDFEMALGNERVVLAFAGRIGNAPALPSRLLQRLEAFLGTARAGDMRQRGEHWLALAHAIDAAGPKPVPAPRPMPRPKAEHRPRQLSVTDIETLFRSPYDTYAKYSLGLRSLDPLGQEPGGRDRGTLIHAVFSRFVTDGHDPSADDALSKLEAIAVEAFAGLDSIEERRHIWLRRLSLALRHFLDFEIARGGGVARRHAEVKGSWSFPALEGFRLGGRADRIDVLADGSLEIIDFKTGSLPDAAAMKRFEAPQLLLEAAMARAGAWEGIAPAEASALTYIKIGLGPKPFTPSKFKTEGEIGLAEATDEIEARMQRHVKAFLLEDSLPMTARLLPAVGQRFAGAYDHLARTAEWTLLEGEDEA